MFLLSDDGSKSTGFFERIYFLASNYDFKSLCDLIYNENTLLLPLFKNDILKIILKINIIFYVSKNKQESSLYNYGELSNYQETCYLNTIIYFLPYIQNSMTFELIKNKVFKSLISLLSTITSIDNNDYLRQNEDYNYLMYLHEELVYYIISFNKFKSFISCFDNFMESSKLNYDYKNQMSNHLLMSDFVKQWIFDLSIGNETEETSSNCCNQTSTNDIMKSEETNNKITQINNTQFISSLTEKQEILFSNQKSSNDTESKEIKKLKVKQIKNFKFEILKRKNIDKVTITYFRKYLNTSKINIENDTLNGYTQPINNKALYFKSINPAYLFWFFYNQKIKSLFEDFIYNYFNQVIGKITMRSNPKNEEITLLKQYLLSMPKIYS